MRLHSHFYVSLAEVYEVNIQCGGHVNLPICVYNFSLHIFVVWHYQ